jgi:hypothetical protein
MLSIWIVYIENAARASVEPGPGKRGLAGLRGWPAGRRVVDGLPAARQEPGERGQECRQVFPAGADYRDEHRNQA